ncbi:endo alpha-1,4 polygalactosaminidase [Actinoplanes sp. NPDC049681]|uniref:endo alpha-1,4 polygalactosaminidase n=1 Tax=Actinoplanes sp. NPDC049681 TaxID=3363905 RepID=UPI0037976E01
MVFPAVLAALAAFFVLHTDAAVIAPPPVDATFDYQIGAAYDPPAGVTVVSRDREAPVAPGMYTICYVNAYQTQPGEVAWWQREHDDLLLRGDDGEYVVDGEWNEILLDVSTPAKREAIAGIVGGWIDGCARDGFRAVEPDNIDSYDRSDGRLTVEDSIAYLELLVPYAHRAGLALGQKNAPELGTRGRDLGLDFAIAEDCGRWEECTAYTGVYGHVIDVEYTDGGFRKACRAVGAGASVVRRDVKVTAPGSATYRYDAC